MLTRLVLVRHGETVGESSIRYHGANDVELSESGREQMRQVAAALAGQSFDAVFASALRRASEAAAIIAPQPPASCLERFNEINFGEWEGLTSEEIAARDPELHRHWHQQLHQFQYPGGESVPAFRQRITTAWRELYPTLPARVLIVAHKGVIATILEDLLGWTPEQRAAWPIELGSIHIVRRSASQPWSLQAGRS